MSVLGRIRKLARHVTATLKEEGDLSLPMMLGRVTALLEATSRLEHLPLDVRDDLDAAAAALRRVIARLEAP